jgi:hypothetical protein
MYGGRNCFTGRTYPRRRGLSATGSAWAQITVATARIAAEEVVGGEGNPAGDLICPGTVPWEDPIS